MVLMAFYTSVISIIYLFSSIYSHVNNPFSDPRDFLSWVLDSGLQNIIEQSVNKSGHFTVDDCLRLDPKERDKCYHDLARKHRRRAPSTEPVFDDNGNLILFEEATPHSSHDNENPPSGMSLLSNSDSEKTFPRNNLKATKSTIKVKKLSNGQNIITVVKEGDIIPVHGMEHHQSHHMNHGSPYDIHISPLSAHNMENLHDEISSEISKNSADSDHECGLGYDKYPLKENQFRVTGTLKSYDPGYKEDPSGQTYQYYYDNPTYHLPLSSNHPGTYYYSYF